MCLKNNFCVIWKQWDIIEEIAGNSKFHLDFTELSLQLSNFVFYMILNSQQHPDLFTSQRNQLNIFKDLVDGHNFITILLP